MRRRLFTLPLAVLAVVGLAAQSVHPDRSLFDGKTTKGWRGFKKPAFPDRGWVVEDGWLKHAKTTGQDSQGGGDIITVDTFDNFDLQFEWKIAPGNPNIVPHTVPSGAGARAYGPPPYWPGWMRLSFAGSTGAFGSVYSSRRPFPLRSMISGVHPCAFSSSPVSSQSFVFTHPMTGPPPLSQSVRFASSANIRWWVPKQVEMCFISFVFGSYTARCRPEVFSGKRRADA